MILRRLGNKKAIAHKIIERFPPHRTFIDLFFGAGGLFFQKPLADYNFCNDADNEVFNLFMVLKNHREELEERIKMMPIHHTLFQHWRKNEETDPIWQAVRFLMLSNFGYMVTGDDINLSLESPKKVLINRIGPTFEMIKDVKFRSCDFREMLKGLHKRDILDKPEKVFIYADPPYLGTENNYKSGFTEQDSADLFKVLTDSGIRFAMSEFDHPFILEQAENYGLNVLIIGERRNMKNRRTEILVTNYEPPGQIALF